MNKDKFIIKGFGGKKTLSGSIEVRGSKNSALPVMASSILFKDEISLKNIPQIEDVFKMSEILNDLGVDLEFKKSALKINSKNIKSFDLNLDLAKKMRASIVLSGPILARFGKVSFPHPGGCVIGERPINIFLEGFKKMGASLEEKKEKYFLKVTGKKLKGAEIFFPVQSVGATETFMMAGVLAEGKTVLKNCALEPEILALGEFLNFCGAKIKGLGTTTLNIEGGKLLSSRGKIFNNIPDRLETGCFLILGALSAKRLRIKNCQPEHLEILIENLKKSGVKITKGEDWIEVKGDDQKKDREPFNVKTHEYPGFPTDLQAPIVVYLTQAEGESIVFETIFESRLNYIEDLIRMGAEITAWNPHQIMIRGATPLKGRELEGPDIRAGLAFVIAAIIAKGRSVINNVYYIDRGYERIEERLRKIGVDIVRSSV